ncbi:hypothetical protein [Vibrio coralliilyticus]|uniref:hypothetical protein n=1 Tax=Vibrio coralliilyticus TaxID=190893 RepID=UPI001E4BE96F|nr:hypothetical protein [Vibrio coralliilyticus]MCC2521048.1 hypothetical protein [Vibrio coralliilyticus]
MKELSEIVNNQISSMINDGAIEEMIQERLNQAIKDSVDQSMRSYGDFGKALEAKVSESLNHALQNVTLPEYNQFIANAVSEAFIETLNENGKARVLDILNNKLGPTPKEITATELLEQIGSYWRDEANTHGHEEIEINWNETDGSYYLEIVHPEYSWQTIKVTFYDHRTPGKYHIGYINEDKGTISGCISGATHALGLAGYLYQLYCAGTTVTGLADEFGSNIYIGWD